MTSQAIRSSLAAFKDQLEQRQQERRKDRLAKLRAEPVEASLSRFVASPDVGNLFQTILAGVVADSKRYRYASDSALSTLPDVVIPQSLPSVSISMHVRPLWDAWISFPVPIPPIQAGGSVGSFGMSRGRNENEMGPFLAPPEPLPAEDSLPPTGGEGDISNTSPEMRAAHQACLDMLLSILGPLMDENATKTFIAPALLLKLRHAVQAFNEYRVKDATTLLKNAVRIEPHNPHIAAMLSQIYYYMAGTGNANVLPEAREFGQRCLMATEKATPEQLATYRYLALATERGFSAERVIEWMRDYHLLETAEMEREGLFSAKGLYLRIWGVLATIPVELWKENEISLLRRISLGVIGGGLVYLLWFQKTLFRSTAQGIPPMPGVEEIERLVKASFGYYNETADSLRQIPIQVAEYPWLLRVRYLRTFVAIAPLPTFDQALCNIALNAEKWMVEGGPNVELRALLNDHSLSYWNIWALVLTPFKDVRLPYLLPAEETLADAAMLAACDDMLNILRNEERSRMRSHLWNDLKPWMPRWEVDHFLAAATGSNKPRSRFAPSLTPYTHFYRYWQDPVVQGYLASEVVQETARRGGFASLFEVLATIDGAHRLMDDPAHGMVNMQKRALAAANRYNPRKFKTVQQEFGLTTGASAMAILLPLAGLGAMAAILTFSSNWGQAFGLILALLGVVGVILLNVGNSGPAEA
jgi:hypothetical protein